MDTILEAISDLLRSTFFRAAVFLISLGAIPAYLLSLAAASL